MKKPSEMGKNLTGMGLSPSDSKTMAEFAADGPLPPGSQRDLEEAREVFARESGVVGSIPPPASIKGLAKSALDAIQGKRAGVFIDRLAERLAFERTGTRLYEALTAKYDAEGGFDGGPSRGGSDGEAAKSAGKRQLLFRILSTGRSAGVRRGRRVLGRPRGPLPGCGPIAHGVSKTETARLQFH